MAQVIKRVWKSGPRKVKRVAWGYTLQVPCNPCPHRHPTTGALLHPGGVRQDRVFDSAWTQELAEKELAARLLERDAEPATRTPEPKRLAQMITEYLDFKRAKGKRSIRQDEQICAKLTRGFGAETLVAEVTAQRIAQYDRDRVTQTSRLGRLITPSTVNRELAILRHMLRLAEEWGYIVRVPRIRLAREPEGRLRFLAEAEIVRLLDACQGSKSRYLTSIATVALNTGMRKGEILGLTWARVDFARGVLLLERTKSGRRREIPMNQAVYGALQPLYAQARAALPAPATGEKAAEPEGLVYSKVSGAAWGSIRTAFERACTAAKIEDFRFHDLRHTYASHLVMRGRSLKEVQELLGHQEFTMTLRYAHLSPDRLREAVEAVNFSTSSAQTAIESSQRLVSVHAPVAQVDRAAVS